MRVPMSGWVRIGIYVRKDVCICTHIQAIQRARTSSATMCHMYVHTPHVYPCIRIHFIACIHMCTHTQAIQ